MEKINFPPLGLVVTGIGLLLNIFWFIKIGSMPGLLPIIGATIFLFGTAFLSFAHGNIWTRLLSILSLVTLVALSIPWGGDYTPQTTALVLLILLVLFSLSAWGHLIYRNLSGQYENLTKPVTTIIVVVILILVLLIVLSFSLFRT